MDLAFLADENVEMDIVDQRKSLGYIATHASELPHGRPETAVLQAASRAGQVLITNDKDFGDLVFRRHHRFIALPASCSFGCPVGLQPSRLGWLHTPSSATAQSFWARSR